MKPNIWYRAKAPFNGSRVKRYWDEGMGRWRADIEGEHNIRMLYSRYMMCVHLGEILPRNLHVDHINNDKTDDRIKNFQVLTVAQHNKKTKLDIGAATKLVTLACPICHCSFERSTRDLKAKRSKKAGYVPTCSRSCGTKYGSMAQNPSARSPVTEKVKKLIPKLRSMRAKGFSSYSIAEETGLSRNTVMKHW